MKKLIEILINIKLKLLFLKKFLVNINFKFLINFFPKFHNLLNNIFKTKKFFMFFFNFEKIYKIYLRFLYNNIFIYNVKQ